MKKISPGKFLIETIIHFIKSTKHSLDGLKDSFKSEKSFHFWVLCLVVFLTLAYIFQMAWYEYFVIFIVFGLILVVELLNTAIENVVDMVTLEFHPLAKRAKDCASAASGVLTFIGIVIGIMLFFPYIIK